MSHCFYSLGKKRKSAISAALSVGVTTINSAYHSLHLLLFLNLL